MLRSVELVALRQSRARAALRQVQLARSTIRGQRSDLARVVRDWNRIVKRINRAIERYDLAVAELGIDGPDRIDPTALLGCLKDCVEQEQTEPLAAIEATLKENERAIRAAGRKREKQRQRRAAGGGKPRKPRAANDAAPAAESSDPHGMLALYADLRRQDRAVR